VNSHSVENYAQPTTKTTYFSQPQIV